MSDKSFGGRPTKFEDRFCGEFIEFRSLGWTIVEIAHEWSVDTDTIQQWRVGQPSFSVAYTRAKAAYEGWYSKLCRTNGCIDTKNEKVNINQIKWLGYINLGLSENSINSKYEIDCLFYDKNTMIEDKQAILDKALAKRKITTAIHESLSSTLHRQFERIEGRKIVEARMFLEQREKELKQTDKI